MPLIKPETQAILRAAGLGGREPAAEKGSVAAELDGAGLDLSTIAEELFNIAKNSGSDGLRLRALETALKAHGALKETTAPPPTFILNIQPSFPSQPTENLQGVNPLLVPRQLLNELTGSNTDKNKSN